MLKCNFCIYYFLLISLLCKSIFSQSTLSAVKCRKAFEKQVQETNKRIENDNFDTRRGFRDYAGFFPILPYKLELATTNFHWIDIGAGESRFMLEYHTLGKFKPVIYLLREIISVRAVPFPNSAGYLR